jgi:hypothetical protein
MASALDRQLNKLESIVEKFCIAGKEDDAIECVEWARGYADDFPQEADIQEAIEQVKQVGKYPDFSVVLFRPDCMLVSEGHLMKMHENQWLSNLLPPPDIPWGATN